MPPPFPIRRFLDSLEPGTHFEQLLSCVPELNYFAKDSAGRFVMMDEGFVTMLGCRHRNEILGKTDFDFFPKNIAEKFVADDQQVIETGRPSVASLVSAIMVALKLDVGVHAVKLAALVAVRAAALEGLKERWVGFVWS